MQYIIYLFTSQMTILVRSWFCKSHNILARIPTSVSAEKHTIRFNMRYGWSHAYTGVWFLPITGKFYIPIIYNRKYLFETKHCKNIYLNQYKYLSNNVIFCDIDIPYLLLSFINITYYGKQISATNESYYVSFRASIHGEVCTSLSRDTKIGFIQN